MAINKKQASKSSGNSKKATPAKKAAPVKKAAPAKKAIPAKKATPAKKAAPAKKVAAPAKKATPVKKVAAPAKKTIPAKKAAPAKKVVAPAKKAAPVKKVAAPAKKAVPARKVAQKPAPVAKKAVKQEPVVAPKKEAAIKSQPVPVKKTASVAKTTKILKSIVNNSSGTPVHPAKPTPAPVGRSLRDDKKPQIIVAHRRLHKDNKEEEGSTVAKTSFTEFNRSLLDEQPAPATTAKRYSDEDLNEFREIINSRLDNARKELAYLQGLIMRKDSAGTEDSENRFNVEDGSGAMERETVSQLASRQIQFISNLEKALIRIENKTYGVCRVTGKLIDKARLRAVPHATLSIEAKTGLKK